MTHGRSANSSGVRRRVARRSRGRPSDGRRRTAGPAARRALDDRGLRARHVGDDGIRARARRCQRPPARRGARGRRAAAPRARRGRRPSIASADDRRPASIAVGARRPRGPPPLGVQARDVQRPAATPPRARSSRRSTRVRASRRASPEYVSPPRAGILGARPSRSPGRGRAHRAWRGREALGEIPGQAPSVR